MEEPSLATLFVTVALSGILAHHVFFKRFEIDTHPLLIFVLFLGGPSISSFVLRTYTTTYAESASLIGFLLVLCFLLSLWASILGYRAFFHPLRKFPGPFYAKLTKFWALSQAAKTHLKWYQVDHKLHLKYGDYVRTGIFNLLYNEDLSKTNDHRPS